MIEFKRLSTIMAIIAFVLFACLLLMPESIFYLFQIPENESAFFISRRAAMLYLGIGVLSWLGRNAVNSLTRQSVCMGLAVAMLGMATLGAFEFIRGFAGVGIGLAVATELLLGIAYLKVWLANRGLKGSE